MLRLIYIVATASICFFAQFHAFSQSNLGILNHIQKVNPQQGSITVSQSEGISKMISAYYIQNASRPGMNGFRIRIFFDLGQQSRSASEEVVKVFMEKFPGIAVYRNFDSPYYKVSVGDFRTRDEALKLLNSLENDYPKAFIVPEWINFPRLD